MAEGRESVQGVAASRSRLGPPLREEARSPLPDTSPLVPRSSMHSYSSLDRPAQFLKGVGPKRAGTLARIGLLTARDVLYHIPHRYEDASTVRPIGSLETGDDVTVVGRVVSKGVIPTRKRLRIFQAVIRDRSGSVEVAWPGQPHLDRVIRRGDLLLLTGNVRFFHGRQLHPREFTLLAREDEAAPDAREGRVFPVYPATEGLGHRQVRKIIADNLDGLLDEVVEEDPLPPEAASRLGLPSRRDALEQLHRPASMAEAERGRQRLAYEELLLLQLAHALVRRKTEATAAGTSFRRVGTMTRDFISRLPFSLTTAQTRVLREIGVDMAQMRPMSRLLQGDVGSGKTVVALAAMLRAVENGFQAALMAPTEILAEQHARTMTALLNGLADLVLLTGRLDAAEHRRVSALIADGSAPLIIGTHALIQEGVRFHRLGLAVVDEQHRFGVRQRMALRDQGEGVDLLVMSATPIPRSLALTLYGDLDISVLDELPPGRVPVRTGVRRPEDRERVYGFVREQVERGRQAYVVYPLVEESEKLAVASATEGFQELGEGQLAGLRIALVHGQLPPEEKDRVMTRFVRGEIDVLIATTVIEVGIDVPNATVMVVEHAERYGLSQLHQLRGRVGRGGEESYCILIPTAGGERERLRVMAETNDGFEIARADLRIRGQGELIGSRQSGVPAFRFAELERDTKLVDRAREDARALVERDPRLETAPRLRAELERSYAERLEMFGVG